MIKYALFLATLLTQIVSAEEEKNYIAMQAFSFGKKIHSMTILDEIYMIAVSKKSGGSITLYDFSDGERELQEQKQQAFFLEKDLIAGLTLSSAKGASALVTFAYDLTPSKSHKSNFVKIFSRTSKTGLFISQKDLMRYKDPILSMNNMGDKFMVFTFMGGYLKVIDLEAQKEIFTQNLDNKLPASVAVNTDLMAYRLENGQVEIRFITPKETPEQKKRRVRFGPKTPARYRKTAFYRFPMESLQHTMAFSPDGQRLAVAFTKEGYQANTSEKNVEVMIWDVRQQKLLGSLNIDPNNYYMRSRITALAWSKDGKRLLTGSETGAIIAWNSKTMEVESTIQRDNGSCTIFKLGYHSDKSGKEKVISADSAGQIVIWEGISSTTATSDKGE